MKNIKSGFILPSAAYTIPKKLIKYRDHFLKKPEPGDLVYGSVIYLGHHKTLENKEGRIHKINDGTKAIFVYGNRYAPDAYEGRIPDEIKSEADLLARSGIIGDMVLKNSNMPDCTKIKIYGYVVDKKGSVLNTKQYSVIKKNSRVYNSKMILCIGAAMNSGKSQAAARCCWALSNAGHRVNACKITGTASLKDILLMEDNGAGMVADFTFMGYPSTYLLDEKSLKDIYIQLQQSYAPNGFWVVEFADGILQKETDLLLRDPDIRNNIHKLIFCAHDAVGVMGGLNILKNNFDMEPDAISGYCSSAPLAVHEFQAFTKIPVFDSMQSNLKEMMDILL